VPVARTGTNRTLVWDWKPQQLGQGGGAGMMHGRAHDHLNGFQIHVTGLLHTGENGSQQLFYFARDFLLDRICRFFSCSLSSGCSRGRNRQIFSFTSRNERLSS
jgi:hypothetical protein